MGYQYCECRDCSEIIIDGGLCGPCEKAECQPDEECQAPDAHTYCSADSNYDKDDCGGKVCSDGSCGVCRGVACAVCGHPF